MSVLVEDSAWADGSADRWVRRRCWVSYKRWCIRSLGPCCRFACAENLKYLLTDARLKTSWSTTLFRCLTAVPLHTATTGYVSARIGGYKFRPRYDTITNAGESSTETVLPLADYVSILVVPVLCHGVYDSTVYLSHSTPMSKGQSISTASAVCTVIAALTVSLMVVIFANQWRMLSVAFSVHHRAPMAVDEMQSLVGDPTQSIYVDQPDGDDTPSEYDYRPPPHTEVSPALSYKEGSFARNEIPGTGVELAHNCHGHDQLTPMRSPLHPVGHQENKKA
eukprot:GHVN01069556.1.p1 GENE.GHVN01069556.1~~GHVN01069556.1.p1  ORF type:complete len:279 (+),score=20.96 GHVN01069556.1:1332-2168(+)